MHVLFITDSQMSVKTVKENIPHGWIFASFMVKYGMYKIIRKAAMAGIFCRLHVACCRLICRTNPMHSG